MKIFDITCICKTVVNMKPFVFMTVKIKCVLCFFPLLFTGHIMIRGYESHTA